MTNLLAAELLKLRTLRTFWGFLIVTLGLAALVVSGNIGAEPADDRLETEYQYRIVLDGAFTTGILALLLGMLLVTNEFRHGTITRTLLVTPRRDRLLAVKLVTGAGVGAGLMAIAFVVTATVALIWLSILDVPLEPGEAASAAGRAFVGVALAGLLGAALGGAVHSQVGALVGTLVWLFVAEPLVWVLLGLLDLDSVAEYLPGAWVLGIAESGDERKAFPLYLAVGLGWAALAALLAVLRTGRRDIT
jgi:ABC-2 type transport system permease protein